MSEETNLVDRLLEKLEEIANQEGELVYDKEERVVRLARPTDSSDLVLRLLLEKTDFFPACKQEEEEAEK